MPSGPIALDASYSLGRNLSGVGVYCRRMLDGLAAQHPEERFLFAYRNNRIFRSFSERLPSNASRALLRTGGISPWRCRLFHGLNQRLDRRFPRALATFHDLFVLTAEYSTPDFRQRFARQARQAAAHADLIIAVSNFTASQVRDLLRVEPARIRVVHHGVEPPASPPPSDAARENVILHVGAIQKRKNLVRLIEAFESTPPEWRLVLAGSQGFGSEEVLARAEASPRRAQIALPGYVDERALDALYRSSRIFAFPSLDEGFGIPVLEAMAHGLPVLTSNGSALSEVAGNAALLVDPNDAQAIAAGLCLLTEGQTRERYRILGEDRVRNFTWRAAVDGTWRVYKELL